LEGRLKDRIFISVFLCVNSAYINQCGKQEKSVSLSYVRVWIFFTRPRYKPFLTFVVIDCKNDGYNFWQAIDYCAGKGFV